MDFYNAFEVTGPTKYLNEYFPHIVTIHALMLESILINYLCLYLEIKFQFYISEIKAKVRLEVSISSLMFRYLYLFVRTLPFTVRSVTL